MGRALEVFAIYRRLVAARVRSQLQYPLSFALNALGAFAATIVDFLVVLVIFHQVPALGGWSAAEVALLYGLSALAFALTDLVLGHIDLLAEQVRQGTFDLVLVRPLPSLLQFVASDFALRRLGKALQSIAVLGVALVYLDVPWTVGRAVMVVVAVLGGALLFAAIWIAFATITFWLVNSGELVNAFSYGSSFLAQYPVNIFGAWLRRLLAYVIPTAFVAYFPALYILDKRDPLGLPDALRFASPLVAAAAALAANAIWNAAVRHYRSAGG